MKIKLKQIDWATSYLAGDDAITLSRKHEVVRTRLRAAELAEFERTLPDDPEALRALATELRARLAQAHA